MKRIFVAGGGTGGHVYPGIAVARALQNLDSQVEIHFVGTAAGLEKKILPKENFPLHLIAGGKLNLNGKWGVKIWTLMQIPWALIQTFFLLIRWRPIFVLGVGGYASGPFVLGAALFGVPTAIWEGNAHPGMTNRWLSRVVRKVYVAFEEARIFFHCRHIQRVGVPLRLNNSQLASIKSMRRENLETPNPVFRILCFGGSQGARAINHVLYEAIAKGGSWLENTHIIHQIGSLDHSEFQKKYEQLSYKNIEIKEFIYDMPSYYMNVDLVICRAGATTLAELAYFGVPAILIPLPLADGHQVKNAESFIAAEAALGILQKDLTSQRLVEEIERVKTNKSFRNTLIHNVRNLQPAENAAEGMAKDILSLIHLG